MIDGLSAGGGAERSLLELAPRLREADVDLAVAYFEERPESAAPALVSLGVPVRRIESGSRPGRLRAVRRLIRSGGFDVVHTTLFEADVIGRLAAVATRARVISSYVNTSYDLGRDRNPEAAAWKLRMVQVVDGITARHLLALVHANSQSVKESIVRHLGLDPDKVVVVMRSRAPSRVPGRDSERRRLIRAELGIDAATPVLLTVGRNEHQKDQVSAVRALAAVRAAHPGAVLLIAGKEGATTADLRSAIEDLGLVDAVQLLGHRDDVPDLHQAADVFVFPTLFEGMPGAVIEAMAMGTPIVASDIGPVRELVDETMARLVPPADPPALAAAIVETLDRPETAEARASRARRRYLDAFTGEAAVAGMVALYRQALAG